MEQHRVRCVVLAGRRSGFEEGPLSHQPNGAWGVELVGACGLRDLDPRRSLLLAAESDDGAWFMGRVVCLNLTGVDPSDGRLDLGGACELRTIGG
jgi:hypothetical protein